MKNFFSSELRRNALIELLSFASRGDNDRAQEVADSIIGDLESEGFVVHCGCCEGYHASWFEGDCRDDKNRMSA